MKSKRPYNLLVNIESYKHNLRPKNLKFNVQDKKRKLFTTWYLLLGSEIRPENRFIGHELQEGMYTGSPIPPPRLPPRSPPKLLPRPPPRLHDPDNDLSTILRWKALEICFSEEEREFGFWKNTRVRVLICI